MTPATSTPNRASAAGSGRAKTDDLKDAVTDRAAELKESAAETTEHLKDSTATKAGEIKEAAASLASAAKERAAATDVGELAASTSNLIDTARPFFLAAFAAVFTVLGFLETSGATSALYVLGAILFVVTAGFSHELDLLLSRRADRAVRRADN